MAFKTYWIFNSSSARDSRPPTKPFKQPQEQTVGEKQSSRLLITESKQRIKREKEKEKKKANEKQREEWIETVQTLSLSDSHRPTRGRPPYSSFAQRSLLATGQFSWLEVDRKIPFGFRRGAVRKVITALLPVSLLPAAVSGGSFSSKYGKWIKKPCQVTKSILLLAFVTVVVFTWFLFFFSRLLRVRAFCHWRCFLKVFQRIK